MKTRSKIPKMLSLTVFLIFILSIVNSQLVLAEQFTFKYDSAGNMVTGFNYYYEYDGFNQLKKVKENNETGRILEEYWYGAEGSRIKKVHYNEDGTKETFYYLGEDFVRKINSSGTYDTNYYYLGSELVAEKENNETLFFHPDQLGSTSLITDESGNAVEKTTYLPFGGVDEGGNEEERLYTGKEKDDTGLMYYGARYYSPLLMKFTQPDTLLPDVYDPQQLNRYSYARNNPYKYTDPTGNFLDIVLDIGFIGYDAWTILKDPGDWRNWAALGADTVGAVVPFATGLGMGIRIATKADDIVRIGRAADHVNDARKTLKLVDKVNDARSPSNSIKRMFSSKKGAYGGSRYTEQAGDVILDSHQTQHIKRSLSESALQKSTKNSDKSLFSNKVDHQEIVSDTFKTGTKVKTDVIVKKYDYSVGYSKGSPTNYVQVQITDLSKNSMHGFPIDKQSYLKRLNGVR